MIAGIRTTIPEGFSNRGPQYSTRSAIPVDIPKQVQLIFSNTETEKRDTPHQKVTPLIKQWDFLFGLSQCPDSDRL